MQKFTGQNTSGSMFLVTSVAILRMHYAISYAKVCNLIIASFNKQISNVKTSTRPQIGSCIRPQWVPVQGKDAHYAEKSRILRRKKTKVLFAVRLDMAILKNPFTQPYVTQVSGRKQLYLLIHSFIMRISTAPL